MNHKCKATTVRGEPCKANHLHESDFCLFHDPNEKEKADSARRARRGRGRKEAAILAAYQIEGLDNVEGLRRVLQSALADLLPLENTIERARAMIYLVQILSQINKQDLEKRVEALEEAMARRSDEQSIQRRMRVVK